MAGELEVLRAACCIAGLDGNIDRAEIRYLRTLAERAGVGLTSLEAMVEQALENRDFYEEQFQVVASDPDRAITALFTVAIADGRLVTEERVILRHFADRIGVPGLRFEKLLRIAERNVE